MWVGDHNHEGVREPTNYYSPADQVGDNWNEQMMFVLPKLSGAPAEVIDTIGHLSFEQKCERYKVEAIEETTRNGYPIAIKFIYCSKNRLSSSGKGSVGIIEVINATSGPCVLFRQILFDPFDVNNPPLSAEKKTELLDWAKRIYMCNARDPAHPCPKIKW